MTSLGFIIDRFGVALIVFAVGALMLRPLTRSGWPRILVGAAALASAVLITISHRSLLEWGVSAVDRLTFAGILMLTLLALSSVTGRDYTGVPQYRFGAALLALTGLALYPSAVGLIDYDAYRLGYNGIALPAFVGAILGYAIWRRYWVVVGVIDMGVAAYLLELGRSFNLWDYLIDPVASVIGLLSWVVIAMLWLTNRIRGVGRFWNSPAQASGETPISHS